MFCACKTYWSTYCKVKRKALLLSWKFTIIWCITLKVLCLSISTICS